MLCAAALPYMSIYTVHGGQTKKRGSQINIKQDLFGFAKSLPRVIEDVPYIWINKKQKNGYENKLFKVRKNKIKGLLDGLKKNKVPWYTDIEFNWDNYHKLPDDGIPDNINNIEIRELIQSHDQPLLMPEPNITESDEENSDNIDIGGDINGNMNNHQFVSMQEPNITESDEENSDNIDIGGDDYSLLMAESNSSDDADIEDNEEKEFVIRRILPDFNNSTDIEHYNCFIPGDENILTEKQTITDALSGNKLLSNDQNNNNL